MRVLAVWTHVGAEGPVSHVLALGTVAGTRTVTRGTTLAVTVLAQLGTRFVDAARQYSVIGAIYVSNTVL